MSGVLPVQQCGKCGLGRACSKFLLLFFSSKYLALEEENAIYKTYFLIKDEDSSQNEQKTKEK